MKKYLLLIFTVLLSASVYGQQTTYTQTIRGKVVDKQSLQSLPGATVIVLNITPQIGAITDNTGEFVLKNVPIGRQSIQISFIGYSPVIIPNLNLTSGKEIVLEIEMEEQTIITKEVIIKSNKPKNQAINDMATVSARSFTVEETERFAGSLGDPSRMVANYAGVAMTNDSRNDIIIRGNSPAGLLWRLDGFEIPNPNHFGALGTTGGPVSMLNNNLLTNSDFFTGAFPAQYGNAISGVFDLNMRTGNNKKREYVGQIGFNGFEFGAEGPFVKGKNASYMANYRYSTLDVMHAIGIDFGTGQAIPQYQDLTFKINLPGIKYGRFTLIGLGGLSYIELHDSETALNSSKDANYNLGGVDLDFGSDMGIIGLSHLYFINEKSRIETFISVLGTRSTTKIDSLVFDTEGNIIPNANYAFYGLNASEVKYSASTRLKTKFNAKNSTEFGIYYDNYQVNYLDSVLDSDLGQYIRTFDIKGSIWLIRPYAQWQHRFSNKLVLNTGVYAQYININNEISVEPRIGFKYQFKDNQTFSLGYGLHSQNQPRQYYFIQTRLDDGSYIYTNKDLKLTKSNQFVAAYDVLFAKDFRLKTEVYYQSLYHVPISPVYTEFSVINTGDNYGGIVPDSLLSEGTGTNYGIEFTLEKFLSNNYYFLLTSSFFESKYVGYSKIERNTAFNGNFVTNLLGGYEFKIGANNSMTIDLRIVYAGGKRYIPIDLEASRLENMTQYDWSKAYENKFDDYFRTDLRIGFKMNKKKYNQEWAIDLQNLTNSQNIYSQSYNPRSDDINYDYQTGFFPMFLYRIQF